MPSSSKNAHCKENCKPTPRINCKDVIKACDKVIADKDKVINLSDLALKQSQTDNNRLNVMVESKNAQLNSIWRNPLFLIALGIIGGFIIKK